MANFTLELRDLAHDENVGVFSFDYDFYSDDEEVKKNFENRFIEHFYFDEIGFETIGRFKQRLKSKLNDIMPYYKQLYESEIKSKEIDFLLNKDLKETFIRDVKRDTENLNQINDEQLSNNQSNDINIDSDTPQNSIDDIEKYMSTASKSNTDSTSSYRSSGTSKTINNGNESERTEFISQGNIGITSSAELLQKWRDVMININLMIFKDLEDLFIQIY